MKSIWKALNSIFSVSSCGSVSEYCNQLVFWNLFDATPHQKQIISNIILLNQMRKKNVQREVLSSWDSSNRNGRRTIFDWTLNTK